MADGPLELPTMSWPASAGPAAGVLFDRRHRERRVRAPRVTTPLSPSTVIGQITLSHVRLTISGPRASRRLTASQYRALMSLLVRPEGRATAEEVAREAFDMHGLGDPTAMRKCIQRLNGLLRAIDDGAHICWRGQIVSLIIT